MAKSADDFFKNLPYSSFKIKIHIPCELPQTIHMVFEFQLVVNLIIENKNSCKKMKINVPKGFVLMVRLMLLRLINLRP